MLRQDDARLLLREAQVVGSKDNGVLGDQKSLGKARELEHDLYPRRLQLDEVMR